MQLHFYANTLDQQLSRAIHTTDPNWSEFQWYLALQLADITKNNIESEEEFPSQGEEPSISLPSAPKASFYAAASHYKQYAIQAEALQQSKQPALQIHLTNCLLPHSLHWSKDERVLSHDIIENCPWHSQRAHFSQQLFEEQQVAHASTQGDAQQASDWTAPINTNNWQSDSPAIPSSFFVDTTLENTAKAVNMVL